MRLARKIQFPDGFFMVQPTYDWLCHYYFMLSRKDYELYSSFDKFVSDYLDPHTIVVQGPGIVLRFRGVDSWHGAEVHGFITGKAVFGQIDKLAQLGRIILDSFKLYRLDAEVPVHLRGVNRLLENVGFEREGTLRYGGKRGTMIYDTNMWAMTI
jgi:hypothetical protein